MNTDSLSRARRATRLTCSRKWISLQFSPVPLRMKPAFLFTVCCACRDHPKFKHALSFSSLLLAGGAHCLLCAGQQLGTIAAMLSITSTIYHATHLSQIRAADVLLLWTVGASGFVRSCQMSIHHGFSLMLGLANGCILALCVILVEPRCYVDKRLSSNIIRLPWHLAVHAFAGIGLAFLAMDCSLAEDAKTTSLTTLHGESWMRAAVYSSGLVAITHVWHLMSSRSPAQGTAKAANARPHHPNRASVRATAATHDLVYGNGSRAPAAAHGRSRSPTHTRSGKTYQHDTPAPAVQPRGRAGHSPARNRVTSP